MGIGRIGISNLKKKILLVDDDVYILDLYSELLSRHGYVVETATGGKEGMEKFYKDDCYSWTTCSH